MRFLSLYLKKGSFAAATVLTRAAAALALPVWAEVAPMGDDGLYKEPWMRDTFKDLRDDLAEAWGNLAIALQEPGNPTVGEDAAEAAKKRAEVGRAVRAEIKQIEAS